MIDHAPFLRTIAREPDNMDARLVYADWLEERGDVRGEYIRLAVELCQSGFVETRDAYNRPTSGACPKCKDYGGPCDYCENLHFCKLRARLTELLTPANRREWTMLGLPEEWIWLDDVSRVSIGRIDGHLRSPVQDLNFDFNRGFPEILTLRFEELERHYETLIGAMPVREVIITDQSRFGERLSFTICSQNQHGSYVRVRGKTKQHFIRDMDNTPYEERVSMLLAAEFPGADPANPIKYTLPQVEPNPAEPREPTPIGGIP